MSLAADLLTAVLMLIGAVFCLLGAVGLLRFPDTVCRLHAAAKAQTLGLLLVLAGAAAQVPPRYGLVLALVIVFQLVTVPVTSQIVGRTAYRTGSVRRPGPVPDELGERLARESRTPSRAEAADVREADRSGAAHGTDETSGTGRTGSTGEAGGTDGTGEAGGTDGTGEAGGTDG